LLIDVYPDSSADLAPGGRFQPMIAGDVLRGRYRESFRPAPLFPKRLTSRATAPAGVHSGRGTDHGAGAYLVPVYDRNLQIWS
jgi:hypothetical protein